MTGSSQDIKFLLVTATILLTVVGSMLANNLGMLGNKDEFITVVGSSTSNEGNDVATFNASVYSINSDKDAAVTAMNEKVDAVMQALTEFGIPEEDIKTTGLSVYQETTYNPSTGSSSLGDWRATTTVDIRLVEADRANELANVLNSSELGVDQVFGPNFTVNQENLDESELMTKALADAAKKADVLAMASGRKIKGIVSIVEGTDTGGIVRPMYDRAMGGGGGAALAPGTTEVGKTVTVTFRLK